MGKHSKSEDLEKKKGGKAAVIILLILMLAASGFCVYKIMDIRSERQNAQAEAENATEPTETGTDVKAEEEAEKAAEEAEKEAKLAESKVWNLLLVNPWNRIPDDFSVTTAEIENGYEADERIVEDIKAMLADCRDAGFSPQVISTFRTRETQQYLYDHTANKSDTAFPGTSEHECGLAADIIDADSAGWSDPLIADQQDMPAQKWLMEHCQDYGFILRYPADKEDITGIIYEPWHYRYVGKDHAAKIMESGLCLEEYLENEYGVEKTTGSPEDKINE